MKKIIVLLAFALMTTAAYGASTNATPNPSTLKGFNSTKNVNLYFTSSDNSWAAASAHAQGDKEYATTSAFGGIAYKTVTPGSTNATTAPSAPSTPTDSATPSNYTGM